MRLNSAAEHDYCAWHLKEQKKNWIANFSVQKKILFLNKVEGKKPQTLFLFWCCGSDEAINTDFANNFEYEIHR